MFGKASISDYYRYIENEVRSLILREQDSRILSTPTDALVKEYVESYGLPKIEMEEGQQKIVPEKYVKRIPAHQREEFYRGGGDLDVDCERVVGIFPIKENPKIHDISQLGTSRFSLSWSPERELEFNPRNLRFTVEIKGYGFNYADDENQVMNMVKQKKDQFMEWVQTVNGDIDQGNQSLARNLTTMIEERKQKLDKDQGRLSALSDKLNNL